MDPLAILDEPAPAAAPAPALTPAPAAAEATSPAMAAPGASSPAAAPGTALAASPVAPAPAPAPTPAPAPAPKRLNLFDLEAEYLALTVTLDDAGEVPDAALEQLAHRFHAVDDALDRKIEGWARWIQQLEADAEVAAGEAKRLDRRAKSYGGLADRLRERLRDVMVRIGKARVKTPLYTVAVRASPASVASVSIPDLPARFLRPIPPIPPPEPDKRAILEAWRASGAGTPESPRRAPPGVVIRDDAKTLTIS